MIIIMELSASYHCNYYCYCMTVPESSVSSSTSPLCMSMYLVVPVPKITSPHPNEIRSQYIHRQHDQSYSPISPLDVISVA